MSWRATVLTLLPEMFPGSLGYSLAGRALASGNWRLDAINIRGFATDRHRTVDDTPFGGGAGMVLRADIVDAALAHVAERPGPRIYLSPRGQVLTQARVRELVQGPGVTLVCGRFEGLDERAIESHRLEEISLGDFVLSGGEPAAIALIDACVRLLPGTLGSADALLEESFELGLLEYPHYTRPQVWRGSAVPAVLLSGDHSRIRAWRRAQAEAATRERRPDLWRRFKAVQSCEYEAGAHAGASNNEVVK